jgi:hypothetical protein
LEQYMTGKVVEVRLPAEINDWYATTAAGFGQTKTWLILGALDALQQQMAEKPDYNLPSIPALAKLRASKGLSEKCGFVLPPDHAQWVRRMAAGLDWKPAQFLRYVLAWHWDRERRLVE